MDFTDNIVASHVILKGPVPCLSQHPLFTSGTGPVPLRYTAPPAAGDIGGETETRRM